MKVTLTITKKTFYSLVFKFADENVKKYRADGVELFKECQRVDEQLKRVAKLKKIK